MELGQFVDGEVDEAERQHGPMPPVWVASLPFDRGYHSKREPAHQQCGGGVPGWYVCLIIEIEQWDQAEHPLAEAQIRDPGREMGEQQQGDGDEERRTHSRRGNRDVARRGTLGGVFRPVVFGGRWLGRGSRFHARQDGGCCG